MDEPVPLFKAKKFRDMTVPGNYVYLRFPQSMAVLDTPHFQRLRKLYQLGATLFVYPTAEHTRFPHSLGVAHRGREVLTTLSLGQPDLGITQEDCMLVELAGLCHDLGHGPFSHAFEHELLPLIAPHVANTWNHERMSVRLLQHILDNPLGDLPQLDLDTHQFQRVADMILNDKVVTTGINANTRWGSKAFMLDIVSNRTHGIDVDKADYLARDAFMCDIATTADFTPLFNNMRVVDNELCFRRDVYLSAANVFAARSQLFETVYTHPKTKGPELILIEAMAHAAEELGILEALDDPELFLQLNDHIVDAIERSPSESPCMLNAKKLIRRLRLRQVYQLVGDTYNVPAQYIPPDGWKDVTAQDILAHQPHNGDASTLLRPEDVRVVNVKIDWTKRQANPLQRVGFYDQASPDKKFHIHSFPFAPESFMSVKIRVYLATWDEDEVMHNKKCGVLEEAFRRWAGARFGSHGGVEPFMTPRKALKRRRSGGGVRGGLMGGE